MDALARLAQHGEKKRKEEGTTVTHKVVTARSAAARDAAAAAAAAAAAPAPAPAKAAAPTAPDAAATTSAAASAGSRPAPPPAPAAAAAAATAASPVPAAGGGAAPDAARVFSAYLTALNGSKPSGYELTLAKAVTFIKLNRWREFREVDATRAQRAGAELVSETALEDVLHVQLSPQPGQGVREDDVPTGRTLLEGLRESPHLNVQKRRRAGAQAAGDAAAEYHFTYRWRYDVRSYEELLAKMPCVVEGAGGEMKRVAEEVREAYHLEHKKQAKRGTRMADAIIKDMEGVALRYEDVAGVYPSAQRDIVRGLRCGDIVAYLSTPEILGRVSEEKEDVSAAGAAAVATSGAEEKVEAVPLAQLNEVRQLLVAKVIEKETAGYLSSATQEGKGLELLRSVQLFRRQDVLDASGLLSNLLAQVERVPESVRQLWNEAKVDRALIAQEKRANADAAEGSLAFPRFRRTDQSSADIRDTQAEKRKRLRASQALLNAHMKEEDEAGLRYDFGRPFSSAGARKREAAYAAYAAAKRRRVLEEAKQKRQRQEEEDDDASFESDADAELADDE